MARVNVTIPDELVERARAAGLNVSRLASTALAEELDRLAKIAELDAYLAELEAELGPIPAAEMAAAEAWADKVFPGRVLVDAASSSSPSRGRAAGAPRPAAVGKRAAAAIAARAERPDAAATSESKAD